MQIKAPSNVTVFGGSFNPLHNGHLEVIRALVSDPMTERVIVVPNRVSPFKPEAGFLPDDIRLEMLLSALAGWPKTEISDLELRRSAPSYTFRTLQIISSTLPEASLSMALGMDAFAEFARWHHAAEILALAGLVIFQREGWPDQSEDSSNPSENSPNRKGNAESWLRYLPAPWDKENVSLEPDGLVTTQGRLLLREIPHPIPEFSSRKILAERTGEGVPPGAREVLEAYWKHHREE